MFTHKHSLLPYTTFNIIYVSRSNAILLNLYCTFFNKKCIQVVTVEGDETVIGIPDNMVGRIIGKSGLTLRIMQALSGCKVTVC